MCCKVKVLALFSFSILRISVLLDGITMGAGPGD
jgi:hypothetical protein